MDVPIPPWLLELIALVTKCAHSDDLDGGPNPSYKHVVMGYDYDCGEPPQVEDAPGTEMFWGMRVYPASKDNTVHISLEEVLKAMEPNPYVTIYWNHAEFEGRCQGHEVSVELHCHTPRDGEGDAKPIGLMLDGKPYVEPPMPTMGPDFDDPSES